MNRTETEVTTENSLYQTVIKSIAEAEGTEPTELTPPLYEVIDPEALERLMANNQVLGKFVFSYNNHEVSVFTDGYISVKSHTG